MSQSSNSTLLAVAVIGLVGTLGAAVIASWDRIVGAPAGAEGAVGSNEAAGASAEANAMRSGQEGASASVAPYAPPIQMGAQTLIWGENIRVIRIEPGERAELEAQNLFSEEAPTSSRSCAGPGFVVYTWQVRDPYPNGGELEIRRLIRLAMGAPTEQIAMGAMGRTQMGPCDHDFLVNRGLAPLSVQIRFATGVDQGALESAVDEVTNAPETQ